MGANNQMPCDFCSVPYDPVATRWLCPNCHMKTNCCDGAPQTENFLGSEDFCFLAPTNRTILF